MEKIPELKTVGYINYDGEEVSAVHFGIVFQAEIDNPNVEVIEKHKISGTFMQLEELVNQDIDNLETWSKFLYGWFMQKR